MLADPDRIATIAPLFEHVTVACILLGSAVGEEEKVRALHGTRLEMLLTKLVDTTVRGLIYEARGTVPPEALEGGAAQVRAVCEDSLIPYVLLEAEPAWSDAWLSATLDAVDQRPRCRGVSRPRSSGPIRSNRSARIRAVAPQMRLSPTT